MTLAPHDNRFWAPDPSIIAWLCDLLPNEARVLEIGPGPNPARHFPRANRFVDFVIPPDCINSPLWQQCDVTSQLLPYADKSFDFVYCRHLLEDSHNPFAICAEMSRIAKSGFIETPSPIAEMCRGVDLQAVNGMTSGAPWRGYHHHRYLAWTTGGTLNFVSKYPLVEFMGGDEGNEASLERTLRSSPKYWNTYYLWSDKIDIRHHQSPLDFDLISGYPALIGQACEESRAGTDEFWNRIQQAKEAA